MLQFPPGPEESLELSADTPTNPALQVSAEGQIHNLQPFRQAAEPQTPVPHPEKDLLCQCHDPNMLVPYGRSAFHALAAPWLNDMAPDATLHRDPPFRGYL